MKFISIRDLRTQPAEVWEQLRAEPELVLTSHGRPIALLIEINEAELETTVDAVRRARAQMALSRLRRAAQDNPPISDEDIEQEIAAVRMARR